MNKAPKRNRPTKSRNRANDQRSRSNNKPAHANDKPRDRGAPNAANRNANRLRQAAELWQQWLGETQWHQLDRWLKHTLGKNKKYGKRDRLFYGDCLFNAARFSYFAAVVIELYKNETHNNSELTLPPSLAIKEAAGLKALLSRISQSKLGPQGFELSQWRAKGEQALPESLQIFEPIITRINEMRASSMGFALIWHGIPVDYAPQFEALGKVLPNKEALDTFIAQQDHRPPLWLRLNHEETRNTVLAELNEHYQVTVEGDAIAIEGSRGVFGLECFKNGDIEIQDWASQQLAAKVAVTKGQKVWDACAGGGGKTLAIASRMNNHGALWATDIREYKLQEVKRRAKQAGFFNIRTAPWNGEDALQLPKEINRDGGFDWVLVDGPCSSSGTWRRNPDAKLRHLGQDLASLTELQLQLLENAAKAVKPGGHLVYGTCSIFNEENFQIIEQFQAKNSEWEVEYAELLGCPMKDSDSLFAAVLRAPSEK